MMRPAMRILAACLALLCAGTPALAQKGKRNNESKREKIRERLRQVRMARLVEALDLDETTATKLFPKMNDYFDKLSEVSKDNGEARRQLRAELDATKVDTAAVDKLVDRMLDNRDKMIALEDQMLKDVRKILTPTQMARLVIVLPRINRQLEKKIRQAAQGDEFDDE